MKATIAALAFAAAIIAVVLLERAGLVGAMVANLGMFALILLSIGTGVYLSRRSKRN